jgi:2-methylcitrate dehydratase PrpD
MEPGLSASLAGRLADLGRPPLAAAAREAAKDRLLHGIGVTLTSCQFPAAVVAWRSVRSESGGCTVLGRPARLSPEAAAFANAVAAHSSLQEDCGPGGLRDGSHPGTYVIPAAMAAAEASGASGTQLLTALAVGYEAVGLLGEIAPPSIVARRFRPVGILGPIGAAAAAAALLGCSPAQMAAALSIAANTAAGFGQGFVAGSMEPYLHAGFAARNGMLAARLAAEGAAAAPDAFEGPFGLFQTYGGTAGQPLTAGSGPAIGRLGTKRYAACLQNQETIALIIGDLPVPVDAARISHVRVFRPSTPGNGTASPGVGSSPPFGSMLQRQMSARFTAAAALLGRPVDDARYFDSAAGDDSAAAVASRIELISTEDGPVRVEVTLADGEELVAEGDRSGVLRPEPAEIRARFRARAGSVLGPAAADDVARIVGQLETERDITRLMEALRTAQD